ncbi:hypothetical protein ACFYYR_00985 [Streptomyces sp. NPDC001922]|uniref:hypothetical protein n=1 Tax=Streptomyces sp. NPDC001922 TaxID=3364624 RepID=UPI0036A70918
MHEGITVQVRFDGREAEWTMTVEGNGPWSLCLESPRGVEAAASGGNVFEALRSMREELDLRGVTICCNGARRDVRPSGLSASHGAWMLYVLRTWRPPTVRDLVPTFGYCEPHLIGSVRDQDAYWQRHLDNRGNWLNLINPIWWLYFMTGSWGRPKAFRDVQ